jgi:hypothetical protein
LSPWLPHPVTDVKPTNPRASIVNFSVLIIDLSPNGAL